MEYDVRLYHPSDEEGVLELLGLTLPSRDWETPQLWRWKHFENPFGESIITVAESSDRRIVGVTGWMRWRLQYGETIFVAGRPVDTATHPDFQRRGVFSRLTKLAETSARAGGIDLSISTPNAESCPGFLKLGWATADTHGKQLRFLRPFSAVTRVIGNRLSILNGDWDTDPDGFTRIDSLLRMPGLERLTGISRCQPATLRTQKDLAYLKWRYLDAPMSSYYAVTSVTGGDIEAALIVRLASLRGMRLILVEELLAEDQAGVDKLIDKISGLGADLVRAYFSAGSASWAALKQARFKSDPSRTQLLIVKPFDSELPGRVCFSLGDVESL